MARILMLLAVLGFAVSLAPAETEIMVIHPDRDNFNVNYSGETNWNAGGTNSWRVGKGQQEGTYYCDYSYDNLQLLKDAMDNFVPSAPGNWLEVRLLSVGNGYQSTVKTTSVETLDSQTDWIEGTNDRGISTLGASNDNAAVGVPWVTATGAQVTFWNLPSAYLNSTTYVGWRSRIYDAGVLVQDGDNEITLDMPLVMHLINEPNCRGLRMFGHWDGPGAEENAAIATRTQWSTGAMLRLVEVPEPATMVLLTLGGLGVLLRKKR
ncbi:MAG TPA: PEP-CTERM sorting domain-containing protein [Phycisphaerae bacterium]|nr:PEP-CTERM sorting domain-containing protein [Phycisphaerae bacterium]HUU20958.1 PEP-CTERM sorting domain-containing protein [Phycisphaerae bacterium]